MCSDVNFCGGVLWWNAGMRRHSLCKLQCFWVVVGHVVGRSGTLRNFKVN